MARPKPDKSALLNAMAAHVLEHGLNTASLRPLAKSAGTSDRMLIYHFGSKDALVADLLDHLAAQMAQGLDAALPDARFESVGTGVATVVALMRQPAFAPYSRIWLDIVSAASHGARIIPTRARASSTVSRLDRSQASRRARCPGRDRAACSDPDRGDAGHGCNRPRCHDRPRRCGPCAPDDG
jgi:AcrR family transcriptional regulator